MNIATKISLSFLVICSVACGGGGASASDPLVGTWNGTFTWQRYISGVASGSPVSSTASGTIGSNRSVDFRLDFQPSPNFVYDRVLGTVNSSNQIVGGAYWYGVDVSNSYGVHTHNTNFSFSGSQLIGQLSGSNGATQTWVATITLNRV